VPLANPCLSVEILGRHVNSVTVFEALAIIETWIARATGHCKFVVATGFQGLWEAEETPEFKDVLNSADLF
jgi:UDP-N-acetyl-D-mannosaminuronic acid transferase (WecB/TagA/CpsF family)